MKNLRNLNAALIGISALALSACGKNDNLAGKWIQPVPGMPQMTQGFTLKEDGSASSVNMATLKYESWKEENGKLILSGKSIGNHQTLDFTDTFAIEKLTEDSLIIKKGSLEMTYTRQTSEESIPAALIQPAKKLKSLEGRLTIAHETRSLTLDDGTCYWVIDKTGKLYGMYDSVTNGVKNGAPVRAKLRVGDVAKPSDGFAKNYDGVIDVLAIESLALL
jgi:hypothetical protein